MLQRFMPILIIAFMAIFLVFSLFHLHFKLLYFTLRWEFLYFKTAFILKLPFEMYFKIVLSSGYSALAGPS